MSRRGSWWCTLGIVALTPPFTRVATVSVPADYATIQEALDVSGVGDTVLVGPGTYSDWVIASNGAAGVAFIPDGVVLVSEAGPTQTVIDLAPLEGIGLSQGAFVHFAHASGQTVIEGFRVTGFTPLSAGVSGSYSAKVEVRNCVFEVASAPDPATYRHGISSLDSEVRVVNCTFIRCSAPFGAGIAHLGRPLTVEGCTFIECENQAIRAVEGGSGALSLEIRDCLFRRCVTSFAGGGVSTNYDDGILIDGCVFEGIEGDGEVALGIALDLNGFGPKTVTNNVFRDMTFTNGNSCLVIRYGAVLVSGNTFVNIHQPYPPPARPEVVLYTPAANTAVSFENNVVANTSGAEALSGGPAFTSDCNVFWGNVDGIGVNLSPTDRIADPQFCDPEDQDYSLQATSPCLPPYSLGCDLIGALGQGCGSVSVEPESWAKVKAAYRDTSKDGREDGKE